MCIKAMSICIVEDSKEVLVVQVKPEEAEEMLTFSLTFQTKFIIIIIMMIII